MTYETLNEKIHEIKKFGTIQKPDLSLKKRLEIVEGAFTMSEPILDKQSSDLNIRISAINAVEDAIIKYLAKVGSIATAEVFLMRYKELLSKYVTTH